MARVFDDFDLDVRKTVIMDNDDEAQITFTIITLIFNCLPDPPAGDTRTCPPSMPCHTQWQWGCDSLHNPCDIRH